MRGIPEGGDASRGIGSVVGPPEGFTMPDNPYTRQLEAAQQGRSTVSLPPPIPLEAPEGWVDEDLGVIRPTPPPEPSAGPLMGFQGIEFKTWEIIGDNGEAFALTSEEQEDLLKLCFKAAERETLARLDTLKRRLGLSSGPSAE